MLNTKKLRDRRRDRQRIRIKKVGSDRARLSVFRSSKNIYAQIINDAVGGTITSASSLESSIKSSYKTGSSKDVAEAVGKLVAQRASEKGVKKVYFDRGGYLFHGRVKALADAARDAGLEF